MKTVSVWRAIDAYAEALEKRNGLALGSQARHEATGNVAYWSDQINKRLGKLLGKPTIKRSK